jgi:hypothetical protein
VNPVNPNDFNRYQEALDAWEKNQQAALERWEADQWQAFDENPQSSSEDSIDDAVAARFRLLEGEVGEVRGILEKARDAYDQERTYECQTYLEQLFDVLPRLRESGAGDGAEADFDPEDYVSFEEVSRPARAKKAKKTKQEIEDEEGKKGCQSCFGCLVVVIVGCCLLVYIIGQIELANIKEAHTLYESGKTKEALVKYKEIWVGGDNIKKDTKAISRLADQAAVEKNEKALREYLKAAGWRKLTLNLTQERAKAVFKQEQTIALINSTPAYVVEDALKDKKVLVDVVANVSLRKPGKMSLYISIDSSRTDAVILEACFQAEKQYSGIYRDEIHELVFIIRNGSDKKIWAIKGEALGEISQRAAGNSRVPHRIVTTHKIPGVTWDKLPREIRQWDSGALNK